MQQLVVAILVFVLAACSGSDGEKGGTAGSGAGRLELVSGALPDDGLDALVEFGRVTLGTRRSRTLVLRNAGRKAVVVEPPRLTGLFSADLVAPATVEAGESLELTFFADVAAEGRSEAVARLAWEGGRIDLRLRAEGVACRAAVSPSTLDFGALQAERTWVRHVTVENVGEGLCALEAAEVSGAPFAVSLPPSTLLPGAKLSVPVEFTPADADPTTGTLELRIAGSAHQVELRGSGIVNCVSVEPEAIEFDTQSLCDAGQERVLSIRNDCGHDLTVGFFALQQESFAFGASRLPEQGTVLEAGGTEEARIVAWAGSPGRYEGTLQLSFDEGFLLEVPLGLEVSEADMETRIETFLPMVPQAIDVLVVVDDTTAMAPHRGKLATLADRILERLDGHDFHIGVTTVSSSSAPGCENAADGRLLPFDGSGPRIIERETPDAPASLAALLAQESCQDPAAATGLANAWRALDELAEMADDPVHPEPNDGNAGFLRDGSYLLVFFVGASGDVSPDAAATWGDRFASLRPSARALEDVSVQTWTLLPDWCEDAVADPATEVAARFGGSTWPLCAATLDRPTPPPVAPVPSTWNLSAWPADTDGDGQIRWSSGEIAVALDGEEIEPQAEDGTPVWSFEANFVPSVVFHRGHRPHGGEVLTITYKQQCGFRAVAGQAGELR
ncbi:choice-of-anchor D domain-containing protein [Vulgatibacter sp.]|uniref:choice-of-anchor D domain-containing protein n=1 Tax=Vulgatibacter sp. TaxID=1971226 RepID=UPI003562A446